MNELVAFSLDARPEESVIPDWCGRLRDYRERLRYEPQFNPVKQLAFDISRELEADKLSLADLASVAKELSDRALLRRARQLRRYVGELSPSVTAKRVEELVRASAFENGSRVSFAKFKSRWEHPREGVVFTGHPTFAMSEELSQLLVKLVERGDEPSLREELRSVAHAPSPDISLASEHDQAQAAIGNAQEAVAWLTEIVLKLARELYPRNWKRLKPRPVALNTWVGYDLDGRTDIHWYHSLRFRLDEKRRQLERDLAALRRTIAKLAESSAARPPLLRLVRLFEKELSAVARQLTLFGGDVQVPEHLSRAANELTRRSVRTRADIIARAERLIGRAIDNAEDSEAELALMALRAEIAGYGLGTARIHLRLNAMQLHNAIRKPMGLEGNVDVTSRVLLGRLDKMIRELPAQTVNFASLSMERATAIRQFIVAAQILKHVDPEAPIRLLIAECDSPFTVMAALYFAKLFGIEDRMDISPLFETEEAFERGARIIETLLKTKSYRAQVELRGRLCVQTGFSDSGRFMGQVPAALAVERLHGQLAEVVATAGLSKIEVLIFDTHGESMGRGGHPASLADRFAYNMSPWARGHFRDRKINLHHETSFQGGDGFVLFGSPELAFAALSHALFAGAEIPSTDDDSFYSDYDFTRDYFDRVRIFQVKLFEDVNYRASLSAFGTNFLVRSGSRRAQRQYDATRGSRNPAVELRAIPHNALLQQLGMLLNVVSGVGTAVRHEPDRFAQIYRTSERMRRVVGLVEHAKNLSSIKTLVAYSSLFDDAFWVTRPYENQEVQVKEACLYLADLLRDDTRYDAMMHLASYLRKDVLYLDDTFEEIGLATRPLWDGGRLELDVLQAIRIALIQHIFLLAARVPRFSTRNDIARDDIIGLILSLRVDEAVQLLRDAFPRDVLEVADYGLVEQASYTGHEGSDYAEINRVLIDPILVAYGIVLDIGVGISHHFGAHG